MGRPLEQTPPRSTGKLGEPNRPGSVLCEDTAGLAVMPTGNHAVLKPLALLAITVLSASAWNGSDAPETTTTPIAYVHDARANEMTAGEPLQRRRARRLVLRVAWLRCSQGARATAS